MLLTKIFRGLHYLISILVQVKKEHYKALAHFYVALAILDSSGDFSNKTLETLQFLHEEEEDKAATLIEIRVPKNQNEKRYLGMLNRYKRISGAYEIMK